MCFNIIPHILNATFAQNQLFKDFPGGELFPLKTRLASRQASSNAALHGVSLRRLSSKKIWERKLLPLSTWRSAQASVKCGFILKCPCPWRMNYVNLLVAPHESRASRAWRLGADCTARHGRPAAQPNGAGSQTGHSVRVGLGRSVTEEMTKWDGK